MTASPIQNADTLRIRKIINKVLVSEKQPSEFFTFATYPKQCGHFSRLPANLCTANMNRYLYCGYNGGRLIL